MRTPATVAYGASVQRNKFLLERTPIVSSHAAAPQSLCHILHTTSCMLVVFQTARKTSQISASTPERTVGARKDLSNSWFYGGLRGLLRVYAKAAFLLNSLSINHL